MRKIGNQFLSAFLVVILLCTSSIGMVYAQVDQVNSTIERLSQRSDFIQATDPWVVFDMAAMGKRALLSQKQNVLQQICADLGNDAKRKQSTDYARMTLVVTSLGYDAAQFQIGDGKYVSLIEAIANYDTTAAQPTLGTINADVFALLAYDSGAYVLPQNVYWSREKIIDTILQKQSSGGGWSYTADGYDPDLTGMVLCALAPYQQQPRVKTALELSVALLAEQYQQDGGFVSWGAKTSDSAAMVLLGLSALGIDADKDVRFIKDNVSLMDHLWTFQNEEGTFGYTDTEYSAFSTEQVFRGLIGYQGFLKENRAYNVYFFGKWSENETKDDSYLDKKGNKPEEEINQSKEQIKVGIQITGIDKKDILSMTYSTDQNSTVKDVTEAVLKQQGISFTSQSGSYITEIGGLWQLDYGPYSGWLYEVNGKQAARGYGDLKVKDGDQIRWFYSKDFSKEEGNEGFIEENNNKAPFEWEETQDHVQQPKVPIAQIKDKIETIVSMYNQKKLLTDWETIALLQAGGHWGENQKTNKLKEIVEKQGIYRLVSDAARVGLMLQGAGVDIQNIQGVNLLEKIYNEKDMGKQGINGYLFSLLVLTNTKEIPSNTVNSVDTIIAKILSLQNSDGGFPLSQGNKSEVDLTAITITALSPYLERDAVKKSVVAAIEYLAKQQEADGQLRVYDTKSSEAIAQVIIALSSAGIHPDHPLFTKENHTLMDILLSYQTPDGQFAHEWKGEGNEIATYQALQALLSYKNYFEQLPDIYDFSKISSTTITMEPQKQPEVIEEAKPEKMTFQDEKNISSWALPYIVEATEKGIVKGDENGNINPQKPITRAEFVTMLLSATHHQPSDLYKGIFKDVPEEVWYARNVETAYNLGWIYGKTNGLFAPQDTITRQEMAVMIARMKDLQPQSISFVDEDEIDGYAQDAIGAVVNAKIMMGTGENYFNPRGLATREMAIVVVLKSSGAKDKVK